MSIRSRSRSPHGPKDRGDSHRLKGNSFISVLMENIPKSWTHLDVKEYIRAKTVPRDLSAKIRFVKMLKTKTSSEGNGVCAVIFVNQEACRDALERLSGESLDGTLIHVKPDFGYIPRDKRSMPNDEPSKPTFHGKTDSGSAPSNHKLQVLWEGHETFGLNKSYLHSLGINPPLLSRVFVANLDPKVTEAKLREVFGMAGIVLSVTLINRQPQKDNRAMAKIEFDHPVEAVQAISMFHTHALFERPLAVMMDQHRNSAKQLPEGIKGFGPGLGRNGEPLRGIRNSVELLPFKQYLTNEIENLKKAYEAKREDQNAQNQNAPNQNSSNQNNPLGSLLALNSLLNPTGLQQLQNLFSQGITDPLSTLAAFQNASQTQISGIQNQNPAFQNASAAFQNQSTYDNGNLGFQNQANYQGSNMGYQNAGFQSQTAGLQGQAAGLQGQTAGFQGPNAGHQVQTAGHQVQTVGHQVQNPGYPGQNAGFQGQNTGQHNQNIGNNWGGQPEGINQPHSHQGTWNQGADSNYGSYIQEDDNGGYRDHEDPSKITTRDMLMFSNLPSSVTSSALLTKMREVGELKFAEMTGQGRAIVRFRHVEDAVRCIKLFDQSKVDGQKIEVKFF